MEQISSVIEYIEAKPKWSGSLLLLREIILSCPLIECMKWSAPAYTHNGENIIGLAAFKDYVGIWFHQGVFLKDESSVLFNANEAKTKGLRQWRFTGIEDIQNQAQLIECYVLEAIENQKLGKKIKVVRNKKLVIPAELIAAFSGNETFDFAFKALSKAKQIEYANYIAQAKQAKTKDSRLQKIIPMVLMGEGLNDKYKRK